MSKRKGREVSANTQAVRDICDKHGAIPYSEALPHLKQAGASVYRYFTEDTEGKKQGANRYNVAKSAWKKANGKPIRKRAASTSAAPKSATKRRSAPQRRSVSSTDFNAAFSEVKKMGGIAAVNAEIERLQGIVAVVSEELKAVA